MTLGHRLSAWRSQRHRAWVILVFAMVTTLLSAVLAFADNGNCPHNIDPSKNESDRICDETNRRATGLSPQQFDDLKRRCAGVDSLNGKGGFMNAYHLAEVLLSSDTGNCSNAIASCYTHVVNTENCKDPALAAWIAECNEGNVGADATQGGPAIDGISGADSGCGTEGSMWMLNQYFGKHFETNQDIVDKMIADRQARECTEANGITDGAKLADCRNEVANQTKSCAMGVSNSAGHSDYDKFDPAKLDECVVNSSPDEKTCMLRTNNQGTWTPANAGNATTPSTAAKCSGPPPAPTPKACGDTDPDPKTGLCPDGRKPGDASGASKHDLTGRCGKVVVNLLDCGSTTEDGAPALNGVLKIAVSALSVVVGIAAVGGLAWAAVLYAKAGDNQSNVTEAKDLIRNVVIGLFLYAFMVAIINFLVPGGVLTPN